MDIEWWKYIKGYEGLYMVSTFGRVKNSRTGRILKPSVNNCGYLQVRLCKNGITKNYLVHRLVAEAFISNPDNLPTVDHINRIVSDNRVENLRWANMVVQCRNRNSEPLINLCSKSVLQYTKELEFVAEYPSMNEAERQTGIAYTSICACCKGKRKSAGGYIWMYKI